MIIEKLQKNGLVHTPKWLPENTHYLTLMGSIAYGVATENSDKDYYGFCIPPKNMIFPHLQGEILGFGTQVKRFEQWQECHVIDQSANAGHGEEYDFSVYSIVKYFQLCMENNPNMIDSLFTPIDCVHHITSIGQMIRDNRKIFLHKGSWHKFRGYSYGQLSKMHGRTKESKRYEMVEKYGYDLKCAYHVIRLICEVEQILTAGDINLRRDAELLKSIRRGEWTELDIRTWFSSKEKSLEKLYTESTCVPYKPDEDKIKQLLLDCLEEHYGSLSSECIVVEQKHTTALRDIQKILDSVM